MTFLILAGLAILILACLCLGTISVNFNAILTIVEDLTGGFVSPTDATITTSSANLDSTANRISGTLTASTTVPVTKYSAYTLTMSAGAGSINLAALTGRTSEETVVGTGLKVQFVIFRNPTTNANNVTIVEGASNGHPLLGAAFSVTLSPGQWVFAYLHDTGSDVASGDRLLDVTGTGSQTLQVILVLG